MKPITSMTIDEAEAYRRGYADAITEAALALEVKHLSDAADLVIQMLPKAPPSEDVREPWEICREYCS